MPASHGLPYCRQCQRKNKSFFVYTVNYHRRRMSQSTISWFVDSSVDSRAGTWYSITAMWARRLTICEDLRYRNASILIPVITHCQRLARRLHSRLVRRSLPRKIFIMRPCLPTWPQQTVVGSPMGPIAVQLSSAQMRKCESVFPHDLASSMCSALSLTDTVGGC